MLSKFLPFHGFVKPLVPRDPTEAHRAATPLELLFDLIFVVAIATAGQQLHHAIIENHLWHILPTYLMVFFALWWAWMSFSWFASAYDNDDALYRILTFVQIIGSLVIAAGIPNAFAHHDFDVMVVGYLVMRIALVIQWLRVAKHDLIRRSTAYRYVVGIIFAQLGWVFLNFGPIQMSISSFLVMVALELSIPYFAEKHKSTPWHPSHIVERYGLLTIIVLGESIVGSYAAIRDAVAMQSINIEAVVLMIGGLLVMFSMWWAYFARSQYYHQVLGIQPFYWGYLHYFIFVSIAAVGAALAACVDVVMGEAKISNQAMSCIVAGSLILYTTCLWILFEWRFLKGILKWGYPLSVAIILCIPLFIDRVGYSVFAMSLVYIIRLVISNYFLSKLQVKTE